MPLTRLFRSLTGLIPLLLPAALAAQAVTELDVSPDTLRLEPGQRQGLSVQAFDDQGNAVLALKYRSSDTLVVQVAANGTVNAVAAGRASVVVEAGGMSHTVAVLVRGAPPVTVTRAAASVPAPAPAPAAEVPPAPAWTSLSAEPAELALLPTEVGRVQLRAVRADGSVGLPDRVVWRSLRPAVVAVGDSTGAITGMATGQGSVQALIPGGPSVTVPVSVALATIGADRDRIVLSPEDADTLGIIVPQQGGRRLRPFDLSWSASDDGVLEVRPDGVIRPRSAGRAEVIVRGFLQEVRIPVIVHQKVARFAVAPRLADTIRLPVQTTREFTVLPQTVDSLPIEGVPMEWTVGDTGVASFDPARGVLTARHAGRTTLNFSTRGFLPVGWTIEVLPGAVGLDQHQLALAIGDRAGLAAQFVDQEGRPVGPATGVAWVTSDAGRVRVGADGALEAVAPGRAVITARVGSGRPDSATVVVSGDLLVTSTRSGRLGIYTIVARQPGQFIPVLADSGANYLDGAYSPDRSRIAYASDQAESGNYDIYVADADGRHPVRLTNEPGMDLQPQWTSDGASLVFVSARGGVRQVYVMGTDGRGVRALTALPGGAEAPAIAPGGRLVAVSGSATRGAAPDIYLLPMDGGAPRQVTATKDRHEARPFFLPDGDLAWVLHRKDRNEPEQVLRQPTTGGVPQVLVTSDQTLVDVAVSRDGTRLAWAATRPAGRGQADAEFTFQWRALPGGVETSVRLLPGERITSPAF